MKKVRGYICMVVIMCMALNVLGCSTPAPEKGIGIGSEEFLQRMQAREEEVGKASLMALENIQEKAGVITVDLNYYVRLTITQSEDKEITSISYETFPRTFTHEESAAILISMAHVIGATQNAPEEGESSDIIAALLENGNNGEGVLNGIKYTSSLTQGEDVFRVYIEAAQ